jgi:hypothetical protein
MQPPRFQTWNAAEFDAPEVDLGPAFDPDLEVRFSRPGSEYQSLNASPGETIGDKGLFKFSGNFYCSGASYRIASLERELEPFAGRVEAHAAERKARPLDDPKNHADAIPAGVGFHLDVVEPAACPEAAHIAAHRGDVEALAGPGFQARRAACA